MHGLDVFGETHIDIIKGLMREIFIGWSTPKRERQRERVDKRGEIQMCNSVDFNEGINFVCVYVFSIS